MEREVVRIVTPGTITDEALLDERRDNVLASVCGSNGRYGLAWLDLSAGRFSVMELAGWRRSSEVERLRPAEILAPDGAQPALPRLPADGSALAAAAPWHFDIDSATRALSEQFRTRDLAGFGCADKPLAIAAAGALLSYVRETQKPRCRTPVDHHRRARCRAHHGPRHAPQSGARRKLGGGPSSRWPAFSTAPRPRWAAGCCGAGCIARCAIRTMLRPAIRPSRR